MNKVFDIANYLIQLANNISFEDSRFSPDGITHLKLQKMLYYAQVVFLISPAQKKAFGEKILARKYGPVVEEIYEKYNIFGRSFLEVDDNWDDSILSEEDKQFLKRTRSIFGRFSANELVEMTHSDDPWISTPQSTEISVDKIRNFYLGKILV